MTIFDVEAIDLVELAEATGDGEDALGEILMAGASEEARLWNLLDGARSIVDIQDVLAHAQGAFPRIEEAAQWLIGVMLMPALKTVYTSEAAVEVYLRTPDGSPIETLALLKIIALSQTREEMLEAYDLTYRRSAVRGVALRKLAEFFLKDEVSTV